MTVVVTVTKTGTIILANEQLTHKSFPSAFYADAFSYACCENTASTLPALFSFVKASLSIGSTGTSFKTCLL